MVDGLLSLDVWAAFLTLTVLEISLSIDNLVFIAIVSSRVEVARQQHARQLGLALALVFRVIFLFSLTWIMGLTKPVAQFGDFVLSWRDVILLGGGAFLVIKGASELVTHVLDGHEDDDRHPSHRAPTLGFAAAVAQIVVLDPVFSLDTVVTAVGITPHLPVIIAAVTISIGILMIAAGPVSRFLDRHPSAKTLALGFLVMVGIVLVADGLHQHIPRVYLYVAMGFAVAVEVLNVAYRERGWRTER